MANIESLPEAGHVAQAAVDSGAPGIGAYVGTVALVGLGVALIEEELLAGMAVGVAAMAFPSLLPRLGRAFRPLLKSAVRAGYTVADRTRETVAEMSEQFEDVMAEVRAEKGQHEGGAPEAAATPPPTSAAGAEQPHPRRPRPNRYPAESSE